MLTKLRLHNYRTFLNAELSFTRHHLIIGRNNSGKSNLCNAIQFLRACATTDLSAAAAIIPGGIPFLRNWAYSEKTIELSCCCVLPFDGRDIHYDYVLHLRVEDSTAYAQPLLRVVEERLQASDPLFGDLSLLMSDGRKAILLDESRLGHSENSTPMEVPAPSAATMVAKLYDSVSNQRCAQFRRYLETWCYYLLSPEDIRTGWRGSVPGASGLDSRGKNLAQALFYLKNIDEPAYRRVINHTQRIEPDLQAIQFIPSPDQAPVPFVAMSGLAQATWLGLSDGTLRMLALAYIVESIGTQRKWNQRQEWPLIVIEEPENGIYPGHLRVLVEMFEERAPDVQVLFTSHSPYIINLFDAHRDSVTLLRKSTGRTEILKVPPADAADADRLLLAEEYSMELIE